VADREWRSLELSSAGEAGLSFGGWLDPEVEPCCARPSTPWRPAPVPTTTAAGSAAMPTLSSSSVPMPSTAGPSPSGPPALPPPGHQHPRDAPRPRRRSRWRDGVRRGHRRGDGAAAGLRRHRHPGCSSTRSRRWSTWAAPSGGWCREPPGGRPTCATGLPLAPLREVGLMDGGAPRAALGLRRATDLDNLVNRFKSPPYRRRPHPLRRRVASRNIRTAPPAVAAFARMIVTPPGGR